MRIKWPGNRCIICLKGGSLSQEHPIARVIGGVLICSFLCKECNSSLGTRIDVEAQKDPRIRFAVDNLESSMPNLAYKFREGQRLLLHGRGWTEQGKIRQGILGITSRKTEDGALIQSPAESYKSNEKILRKNGIGEEAIQEGLRRLYEAKKNKIVTLTPGRVTVKRRVEQVEPDLRGSKLLTPLFPLKIGYEFLALLLGTTIYEKGSALDDVRKALQQGIEDHPSFRVEELNASEYKPFHGIGFVGNDPSAVVLIRLFGWLAFRVYFRGLAIDHPVISYLHSLDTNQEDIQVVN